MQDVIFVDTESTHTIPPIIVRTTCCASEDLLSLIERIIQGDTPGTRELIAILDDIHHNMTAGRV
ncbi:hypothetical protein LJC15_04700 [Desulfovibrio sp. OttesenSCG-928-G11]|nr:hypothetical protein [Desulfovibrio sp. OttesenSCG-928-G11]